MATPQAPQSATLPPPAAGAPEPHRLSTGYGLSWWSEGWRVFAAAPGTWIALVLIFFVLMFVLALIPFIGWLAHVLLFPVFAGGVMLGCDALARGEPLRVGHLFDGFGSARFGSLVILGLVMLAAGIVLSFVVVVVIFLTLGVAGLSTLTTLTDPANLDIHALYALGAALMIVFVVAFIGTGIIAMAFWFAPALVALDHEEPVTALRKSFVASLRNLDAMVVYGLIYIALSIVATIPLLLGWLVLAPMIFGSIYAGWRTIFARP
jgi:uncharacterized membrane protein